MSPEDAGTTIQSVTEQLDELDFADITLGQLSDLKHPVLRQVIDRRLTAMDHQSHGSHGSHYSSAGG